MDDEKLIALVHSKPVLYDKQNPHFKNKLQKADAWMEIAHEMSCSDEIVMRRWTNLRDRFTKIKKDAQATGDVETTNWHLFDQLKFLEPYIQQRKSRYKPTEITTHKALNVVQKPVPTPTPVPTHKAILEQKPVLSQSTSATSGFATMMAGLIEQLPVERQARAMRDALNAVIAAQERMTIMIEPVFNANEENPLDTTNMHL